MQSLRPACGPAEEILAFVDKLHAQYSLGVENYGSEAREEPVTDPLYWLRHGSPSLHP